MTTFEFALLWCAWVFAAGSPGPATLSIAGTAMNHGRTSGLIFSTGIASQAGYGGAPFAVFTKGALIHLTNPKAILSWGSVYAIVLPADASLTAVFGLFGLLSSGSALVFIGYAILFSSNGGVAVYVRLRRVFELVFAGFFGMSSLKILTARTI